MWRRQEEWYAKRPIDAKWPPEMRDLQARVLVQLGEAAKAESIERALVAANPDDATHLATLGIAAASAGDTRSARAISVRLARAAAALSRNDAIKGGPIALARARLAAALGDSAGTAAFLEEAVHDEHTWIYFMHGYPIFHRFAAYPALQEVAKVRG